ncbi:MAG: hypothetical protein R2704_02715 [Microthrixaceae bacterium]
MTTGVDLSTSVGGVELPNPVMCAAGTAATAPRLARSSTSPAWAPSW